MVCLRADQRFCPIRLNLQHFLHKMDIGYLVHPKIQLPTDNFSIADVGAGTGYTTSAHTIILPTADP